MFFLLYSIAWCITKQNISVSSVNATMVSPSVSRASLTMVVSAFPLHYITFIPSRSIKLPKNLIKLLLLATLGRKSFVSERHNFSGATSITLELTLYLNLLVSSLVESLHSWKTTVLTFRLWHFFRYLWAIYWNFSCLLHFTDLSKAPPSTKPSASGQSHGARLQNVNFDF